QREPLLLHRGTGPAQARDRTGAGDAVPVATGRSTPRRLVARRPALQTQQVLLHRVDDGLHPRVEVELLQDVADVVLDRVLRDVEILSDLTVVQAARH